MQEQSSSISNFKLLLGRILLPLILIVGLVGLGFSYLFEKKIILNSEIVGAYKINRIIHETHTDEIPIFGSSRAEGCFIPDSLGGNYFNYGLSGSKYDATIFFLEEECRKKKNSRAIILNLDLEGLSYDIGDIANYVPNSGYGPVRALLGKKYSALFRIPFLKYYGLYEGYLRDYMNNKMHLTKFTNKGASIEKKALTEKQFNELVYQRRNAPTTIMNDSFLLQKMYGIIGAHPDRYFIFVVAPYHTSYFEKFINPGDVHLFLNKLSAMSNVKVFDFSKMPLTDSMFFNTTHVNYKGAVVFCHQLKDSLNKIGLN
jgi:hypothetical protein